MAPQTLKAEHDAVLESISTRGSTKHFAHAAVSLMVCFMLAGTFANMLLEKSGAHADDAVWVGVLSGLVMAYSAVRLVLALRMNARERMQLARLLDLRRELGFEMPIAL
jgi:hypothetical protein